MIRIGVLAVITFVIWVFAVSNLQPMLFDIWVIAMVIYGLYIIHYLVPLSVMYTLMHLYVPYLYAVVNWRLVCATDQTVKNSLTSFYSIISY